MVNKHKTIKPIMLNLSSVKKLMMSKEILESTTSDRITLLPTKVTNKINDVNKTNVNHFEIACLKLN